ncbi:MAG: 16S rRNA (guanine(966)-N(2))-methyltransferase RsmD [Chloroflexi bacterium]|nr:16S rRNA (guanine(966)-N(2))-methyltransferase RsmD [Chloroflexota bacterium]
MRVISGTARGKTLKMVPGDTTRPILDRAKESLFSILHPLIPNTRWLDVFAGTGQVGLEALSRGAAEVVFVDAARPAIRTIQENLAATKLAENATIHQGDAFVYLKRLAAGQIPPFDLIYIAPPQYKRLWVEALQIIEENVATCLTEGGLVVVQIDPQEAEGFTTTHLHRYDERRYGRTLFYFYEFEPTGEADAK